MASPSRAPRALLCDTNVIIRLLTNDPPAQALAAKRTLDEAAKGRFVVVLTDLVVAELVYVLTSVYGLTAARAAARLRTLLELPGIRVADAKLLEEALTIWTWRGIDFADAYLAALARETKDTAVLSFDRDYDSIDGVTRVDPASVPRSRS